MVSFKLVEKKHKFSLSIGFYRLYLGGVSSIENVDLLDIGITDLKTKDYVTLSELNFNSRKRINKKQAIAFFEFEVTQSGEFEIEINEIENLKLKSSTLFLSNLLFQSKVDIQNVIVFIE